MTFNTNFSNEGINILKRLAFETGNASIENFDFLKDLVHCTIYY